MDDASDKYYEYLLAEGVKNDLAVDASFDAGFEAGVLASEAGVGRYDG